MAEHLLVDRYGDFWLTDAIRPAQELPIVPRQGYRIDIYRDDQANFSVPVLAASVSRERLFDVFLDLLDPLGEVVDVVLETSHNSTGNQHLDLFREAMDLPVLKSHCCDYEEILMNDGCTGIAVMSTEGPMEVQFDEHKLLIVYAPNLTFFENVMKEHAIRRDDKMKLITEGEHLHSTDQNYRERFEQFCFRIGVGKSFERVGTSEDWSES
ncbi:MAG: hypothetical protein HYR84_16305 [Planctomycetes bacterium]|nr:hypothetical protein [Planctomycetota bacterium]